MSNPLIPKRAEKSRAVELPHSAGILDDFAVRKNIATREGTIEKVPVNNSDITNKTYVDSAIDTDIATHVATAQAHSDYMLNTGDTATGAYIFNGNVTTTGTVQGEQLTSTEDADIADKLTVNHIGEHTASHRVVIDNDSTVSGNLLMTGYLSKGGIYEADIDMRTAGLQVGATELYVHGQWIRNSGDYDGISLGHISGGGGFIAARTAATGQPLSFWTYSGAAWGNRLHIAKDGKVGIGTATPAIALDVTGDLRLPQNNVIMLGNTAAVNAAGMALFFDGTNAQIKCGNGSYPLKVKASTFVFNEESEDTDFRIESDNDANNFFSDGGTDRIGIGVAAPAYKLDVNGDINIPASSTYRVGTTAGITATVTYVDTLLGAKTLTFSKGILTAQT